MDAFLESYHVTRLHAQTIGPFLQGWYHQQGTMIGPHARSAVGRLEETGRASIWTDMAAIAARGDLRLSIAAACTVIIPSPDYINVMVLMPQS